MATKFLEAGTSATFGLEFYPTIIGNSTPNITSDTSVVNTGPRSLKIVSDGNSNNPAAYTAPGAWEDGGRRLSVYINIGAYPGATSDFLFVDNAGFGRVFYVGMSTSGTLRVNAASATKTGSTLSLSTWYRLTVSTVITSTTNFTIKVFVNGVLDITFTQADASPLENVVSSILGFGWIGNNGTGTIRFSDVYADDLTALDDPGDIRVTAKLPTTVNANNFDTTIGTGAVNERPLSETNGVQQASSTQVAQNYAIQAASVGDVDVSSATLVARCAWIWAKASATSGTPTITNNGVDTGITLTSTSTLFTNLVAGASYPANAATIGMKSTGTTDDTFLYECGMLIAYIPAAGVWFFEGAPILRSRMRTW